jgi:hypothetical protein
VQKNVVIVAAAGNEGRQDNSLEFPATCAGVLSVGAVDSKKRIWPDTESNQYVSVAAPGWGVGSINVYGKYQNNISGTSQAAALTSAAVALVRAKYSNLSAREVVQRIINTTVDAGPAGRDDQTGSGIVLPPAALTKDVSKSAPNPPFERLDKWLATQGTSASGTGATAQSSTSPKRGSTSGSNSSLLLGMGIGAVVVIAAGAALFLGLRRRQSNSAASYEMSQQSGPPPSFGPGGQRSPYPQQGPYADQAPPRNQTPPPDSDRRR